MKRQKKLLILTGVLAALVLATALAAKLTADSKVVDPEADDVVIFALDPEEVTSLSWVYGGETQTAVLEDGVWHSGEDASVTLDGDLMEELLSQLEAVVAYRTIEEPGTLSDYGLREPQNTIRVNDRDDLTLFLGNETGIGGQYYCSIDDSRVYLVEEELADTFQCGLADLLTEEEEETVSEE
ncbi:MAG: DUF4340 domain-containing protein [Oscillospiraceae bacterium]|nr:DUF4340 domain-containing protein [Oscillospiraceae bacterium]